MRLSCSRECCHGNFVGIAPTLWGAARMLIVAGNRRAHFDGAVEEFRMRNTALLVAAVIATFALQASAQTGPQAAPQTAPAVDVPPAQEIGFGMGPTVNEQQVR